MRLGKYWREAPIFEGEAEAVGTKLSLSSIAIWKSISKIYMKKFKFTRKIRMKKFYPTKKIRMKKFQFTRKIRMNKFQFTITHEQVTVYNNA